MKKWFNVDITTDIDGPVPSVFACLKNIDAWNTWTNSIIKSRGLSKKKWERGFRLEFSSSYLPVPVRLKVFEYKVDECIAWGMSFPLFLLVHRFTFSSLKNNRCRVHSEEYSSGVLGFLALPLAKGIARLDHQWMKDMSDHFK